ncbi:MAG: hydroxysqualene dehydroxylase HpnE [Zoogloeaceae bacterium]|jgi:squalene-associated FAD-dependent desaturase|nr:hydroxysqualene dehydroxylase HpnE [Zoogloeaceae bacterium]
MNVAIIGGGWAGIAAAVTLAGKADVTLFEAGRTLGGRARKITRVNTRGAALDNGQHILLGAYRETLALMRTIGAAPETRLRRLPLRIQDASGFRLALPRLPHPFNLLFGFLGARNTGMGEKLATARWMRALKARRFAVPPEADSSVQEWLDAAGQNGVLRRHLWEPLCLAALNTPAERASARVFARVLQESLGNSAPGATDLLLPRVSLSDLLPEPARYWLEQRGATIRMRERVRALRPLDGRWQVASERGLEKTFDKLILAVAPWHLPPLLAALPRADFPAPPQAAEPIVTLYLDYPPRRAALPYPLLALSGKHGGWLVEREQGALAIALSGRGAWEELTDEALATALHNDIARYFPRLAALPPYQVIREKRATFSCRPRLPRCPQETPWPGLFIAGDHNLPDYPATLESAVRSGQNSARSCLDARANPTPTPPT